jgi:starvation-inducible DNA-binding protein
MSKDLNVPVRSPAPDVATTDGSRRKVDMHRKPHLKPGEYEGNPVGLPDAACKAIGPELDSHLAAYAVLYHQYHKHHWLVKGPQFRDLHLFFEEHYQQVHEHLDMLAERLTALGFVPTCSPSEQEKISYIRHEPEGYFPVRDMLEVDILAEGTVCQRLRDTIRLCVKHDDFGTKRLLEEVLAAAEDRAHHLEHYLEEDTLEIGNIVEADALRERG